MLIAEREVIAEQAVLQINDVMGGNTSEMLADAIKHKLIMLMGVVDEAVEGTERPVLITELVPGYDMMAARSQSARPDTLVSKTGVDVRACLPVDSAVLKCLSRALDAQFAAAPGKGALLYESKDGTHYVAYPAKDRAAALLNMGVAVDEITFAAQA